MGCLKCMHGKYKSLFLCGVITDNILLKKTTSLLFNFSNEYFTIYGPYGHKCLKECHKSSNKYTENDGRVFISVYFSLY